MQEPRQEIHVYGYSAGVVPGGEDPPPSSHQPPPPQRRRLSPLLRILILAFIAACAVIGVLALLVWLIYRPRAIQVSVDSATLSRFTLNSTASPPVFTFNLTAGLTIRNPSKRSVIYYDQLRAEAHYQGELLGQVALPLSYQGALRTDAVRAVLQGSADVGLLGSGAGGVFGDAEGTGVFPVDLWVDGAVQYKFGELMVTSAGTLSARCPLVLQLIAAPSTSSVECVVTSF